MLQAAGMSIAMDNAIPEVKAVAKRTCPSNEENGVAQIIEELLQADAALAQAG